MKKVLSVFFAIVMALSGMVSVYAADPGRKDEYIAKFEKMSGPEVDGLAVDYVVYSPAETQGIKRPLVVFFHGMGQGSEPGSQIKDSNFSFWASDELQSRFTTGGAYLLAFRTHEENNEYWDDNYIPAVKAAIDEFVKNNSDYVDTTRIYAGGFSMGGMMTLKMITSYPDFFAAAFPMCPAYYPTVEQYNAIKNMPLWLLTSKYDVIAGYHTTGKILWENICEYTNVPEQCRLTLFGKVCYPDGKKTPSNHHVWLAAANDLFTYEEGKYYNTVTYDATGKEIELESPDGIISWLCRYTSEYDGNTTTFTDLAKDNDSSILPLIKGIFRALFMSFVDTFKAVFKISK